VNHRAGQWLFAAAVGLIVAVGAYRWVSDGGRQVERELQIHAVEAARTQLGSALSIAGLQLVDPLLPDRKVGKAYVYRDGSGWQVSGYYRRDPQDAWHPYLVTMDKDLTLVRLKVSDAAFLEKFSGSDRVEVLP
jgi:hypothetical protein